MESSGGPPSEAHSHTLLPKTSTRIHGTTAPRKPMARAQRATAPYSVRPARARDQSKRPDEPAARTRLLLHDRHGRVSALTSKSAVELAAWMHAFMSPVPGNKRPRADSAPAPEGRGSAMRGRHAAPANQSASYQAKAPGAVAAEATNHLRTSARVCASVMPCTRVCASVMPCTRVCPVSHAPDRGLPMLSCPESMPRQSRATENFGPLRDHCRLEPIPITLWDRPVSECVRTRSPTHSNGPIGDANRLMIWRSHEIRRGSHEEVGQCSYCVAK